MSYLSSAENVGYSGSPHMSESSCATQYKMAVEGVTHNPHDQQLYQDNHYQAHLPEESAFMNTKFKIDPEELYTFNDADAIAGEITVSDDKSFSIPDIFESRPSFPSSNQILQKTLESPRTNGCVKYSKKEAIVNGHFQTDSKHPKETILNKNLPTKVQHRVQKEIKTVRENFMKFDSKKFSTAAVASQANSKNSINSIDQNCNSGVKEQGPETFLDVFKREMGRAEKTSSTELEHPATKQLVSAKMIASCTGANQLGPCSSSSSGKLRKGRGPTVHEALQRIPAQERAVVVPNTRWHAPGAELDECGPLAESDRRRDLVPSSDEDEYLPTFQSWMWSCGTDASGAGGGAGGSAGSSGEGSARGRRGARLEARRAALRRQVAHAAAALKMAPSKDYHAALASHIKKKVCSQGHDAKVPLDALTHMLASRGMTGVLTPKDRRHLSGRSREMEASGAVRACEAGGCAGAALPASALCLEHVTRCVRQRLYAPCSAVFAAGHACTRPTLPLPLHAHHQHHYLCDEHKHKRDNYDRARSEAGAGGARKAASRRRAGPARRPLRRKRRLPAPPSTVATAATAATAISQHTELQNVCSNSSVGDSSEEGDVGGGGRHSDEEYTPPVPRAPPRSRSMQAAIDTSMSEVVVGAGGGAESALSPLPQHGATDDMLDPAVLNQIPDEAFTEFFNQAEGAGSFAESEELARALEEVLDERVLDSLTECLTNTPNQTVPPRPKMALPTVGVEMSSPAPS